MDLHDIFSNLYGTFQVNCNCISNHFINFINKCFVISRKCEKNYSKLFIPDSKITIQDFNLLEIPKCLTIIFKNEHNFTILFTDE